MKSAAAGKWGAVMKVIRLSDAEQSRRKSKRDVRHVLILIFFNIYIKVIRLSLRTCGSQGAESAEIEQRRREELQEEVNWYKERLKFLQESWMDANQVWPCRSLLE